MTAGGDGFRTQVYRPVVSGTAALTAFAVDTAIRHLPEYQEGLHADETLNILVRRHWEALVEGKGEGAFADFDRLAAAEARRLLRQPGVIPSSSTELMLQVALHRTGQPPRSVVEVQTAVLAGTASTRGIAENIASDCTFQDAETRAVFVDNLTASLRRFGAINRWHSEAVRFNPGMRPVLKSLLEVHLQSFCMDEVELRRAEEKYRALHRARGLLWFGGFVFAADALLVMNSEAGLGVERFFVEPE